MMPHNLSAQSLGLNVLPLTVTPWIIKSVGVDSEAESVMMKLYVKFNLFYLNKSILKNNFFLAKSINFPSLGLVTLAQPSRNR